MGLRPGRCYPDLKKRANTRTAVKVHKRNYIGATPGLRTRQFNMGNPVKKYSHVLDLLVEEKGIIRDNAIEATRIAVNRHLVEKLSKDNFFMKIRIYPHHVLRENKQAQGAHADRIQTGMSHAFGKPIGKAARLKAGKAVVSVLVNEEDVEEAKKALQKARPKIRLPLKIRVGTDVESIGTRPKKVREIVEKKPEEEKAEGEEAKEGAEEEGKAKEGEKGKEEGKKEGEKKAEGKGKDEKKEKK